MLLLLFFFRLNESLHAFFTDVEVTWLAVVEAALDKSSDFSCDNTLKSVLDESAVTIGASASDFLEIARMELWEKHHILHLVLVTLILVLEENSSSHFLLAEWTVDRNFIDQILQELIL